MRLDRHTLSLPEPVAVGAGDARNVEDLIDKWVQVEGAFEASLDVEGRIGSTWVALETFEEAGLVELPQAVRELRVNVTAYTSGTPVVTLGGRNARAE